MGKDARRPCHHLRFSSQIKMNLPLIVYLSLAFIFHSRFIALAEESVENIKTLLQLGDHELASDDALKAIDYYERGLKYVSSTTSMEIFITSLSLYTNLGTAYSSLGKEEDAQTAYHKGLELHALGVEHNKLEGESKKLADDIAAQTSFYLGMSYQDLGDVHKAIEAYKYANELDPLHWAALANLGSVLQDKLKKYAQALEAYNRAYDLLTESQIEPTDLPNQGDMPFILSNLQYYIGLCITYSEKQKCVLENNPSKEVPCSEMAAHAFDRALKFNLNNEGALHMLAAVTADATFLRASNTYVKQLFEDYAENFEHSLVDELGYDGYKRLRRAFNSAFGGVDHVPTFDLVLDAGCGTGLVGAEFRNISQHLVGVDLSPAIIEEAKKARPHLYDDTKVGDVTEIFISMNESISLIIAADSYIYFGDLEPLFSSMEKGSAQGGVAAFTLENVSHENEISLQMNKPDWRWQLTPSGRFAHRREYVESIARNHSFKTIYYEPMDDFRREGAAYVRGHIFIMQKKGRHEDEL